MCLLMGFRRVSQGLSKGLRMRFMLKAELGFGWCSRHGGLGVESLKGLHKAEGLRVKFRDFLVWGVGVRGFRVPRWRRSGCKASRVKGIGLRV